MEVQGWHLDNSGWYLKTDTDRNKSLGPAPSQHGACLSPLGDPSRGYSLGCWAHTMGQSRGIKHTTLIKPQSLLLFEVPPLPGAKGTEPPG